MTTPDYHIPLHPQPSIYDAVAADLGWSPDLLSPAFDLDDFLLNAKSKVAVRHRLLANAAKDQPTPIKQPRKKPGGR